MAANRAAASARSARAGSSPAASSTATTAAASSVQPPENTATRRRSRRSSSSSRSQLQSMRACSVRCRGTAVRRPPVRRRKRSPRPSAISLADRTLTRAAASSRARGMPSRRRQISTMARTFDRSIAKAGRVAVARSTNSRTASDRPACSTSASSIAASGSRASPASVGSASDGTAKTASPSTPRGSRLVASTLQRGTGTEQLIGHLGGGLDEVLAVVEQQEELLRAQVVDDPVDRRLSRLWLDAQGAADLGRHELGVTDRRELDQPGAVAVPVEAVSRGLEREAGLAGAAHADQRHEAAGGEQPREVDQLPLATDERRRLGPEVRRVLGARSQGRERAAQARGDELEDLLGPVEVAQPVLAQVHELAPRRKAARDERRARARDEHLVAVADREQARHPVDRRSEEVVIADLGGPGVDRHPDAQAARLGPAVTVERVLALDRRGQRGLALVERGEHPVAGRLDDRPARILDGRPEQGVMRGEGGAHRGPVLLPEPRAPLDVREQERLGPGRTCRRHCSPDLARTPGLWGPVVRRQLPGTWWFGVAISVALERTRVPGSCMAELPSC